MTISSNEQGNYVIMPNIENIDSNFDNSKGFSEIIPEATLKPVQMKKSR